MSDHLALLLADLRRRLGARLVLLGGVMVASGLTEGVGILLLIPLLNNIGIGEGAQQGTIAARVEQVFDALGLPQGLEAVLVLIVLVFVLQNVLFLFQSHLAASIQHRYGADWRNDLFAACLSARWLFFTRHKVGALTNGLLQETNRLGGTVYLLAQLTAAGMVAVIYTVLAFFVSWQVTAILLTMGVLLFWLTRGVLRWGHHVGKGISAANEDLYTMAAEFLGGAKLIKATATEDLVIGRFAKSVEELRRLFYWSSLQPNLLRSIFELTAISVLCLVLALGVREFGLDAAEILVVVALFLRLYPKLSTVQQNIQQLNVYLPAIGTVNNILSIARAEAEAASDKPVPLDLNGRVGVEIEVRGLDVAYDGDSVLQGLSLTIPRGKTIAIVGPSGAGKSTLVDCLLGFVIPQRGSITINGIEFSQLPLKGWRSQVGYVGQDTFLFHSSVRDNLSWGVQVSDDEELIANAKFAHAHDFIENMPQGYDSIVGDRGTRLSGGQRQRLGLARALLGHPALLILDEATSALDGASESVILDAIEELRGKTTIITIAHRLSTVRKADLIYVLEGGRIVESGSFQELVAHGGWFANMWKGQTLAGDSDLLRFVRTPTPISA